CRTMREADGLAMSSRNLRLTTKQRQQARAISQTLFWMQQNRHAMTPAELTTEAKKILDNAPGLRTEYLQIVDGNNFEDIEQWSAQLPVALYAGYCGEVRLIDNVML
ncbi:MAG: pantoate--beta-alanine ligase, partial [Flavobacteriales bacterium]